MFTLLDISLIHFTFYSATNSVYADTNEITQQRIQVEKGDLVTFWDYLSVTLSALDTNNWNRYSFSISCCILLVSRISLLECILNTLLTGLCCWCCYKCFVFILPCRWHHYILSFHVFCFCSKIICIHNLTRVEFYYNGNYQQSRRLFNTLFDGHMSDLIVVAPASKSPNLIVSCYESFDNRGIEREITQLLFCHEREKSMPLKFKSHVNLTFSRLSLIKEALKCEQFLQLNSLGWLFFGCK